MVNVKSKRCAHHGCTKVPSYGKAGGKAEYCSGHAEGGMVDVKSKRCAHHGCAKVPSYGKAGGKAEYCAQHKKGGMVNAVSKTCIHHGGGLRQGRRQEGGVLQETRRGGHVQQVATGKYVGGAAAEGGGARRLEGRSRCSSC